MNARSSAGRKLASLPKAKITAPGKKPITFREGGLHASLGVPQGKPIPPSKMKAALAGRYGPLAAKQARFAQNVLTGPKRRR